jgi:hypothetical protein
MNLDKATAISALKDRPATALASTAAAAATAEPPSPDKRAQLPKRRAVTLPPPGPAAGPAILSMDPDDDETREDIPEGSSNE